MEREAWHAAVHGVAKSLPGLSNWTELMLQRDPWVTVVLQQTQPCIAWRKSLWIWAEHSGLATRLESTFAPESTKTSAFWVEDRQLELQSEKDWFPPTVSAMYLHVTRYSSSKTAPSLPIPFQNTCCACVFLLPELLRPLPPFYLFKPFLLWVYFTDSHLACSYLNFLSLADACRLIIWLNSFP